MVHRRLIIFFLLVCSFVYSQKIDRFTRFSAGDPILDLDLALYCDETTIDAGAVSQDDAVDEWGDLGPGDEDLSQPNSGSDPSLDLIGAVRTVYFDGGVEYLRVTDTSVGEYTLGTDEFTVMVMEGDIVDDTGTLISKAVSTSGDRLWQIYKSGSTTDVRVNHGGTVTTFTSSDTNDNRLIMVTFTTTQVRCYIDDVEAGNSPATLDTSSGDNSAQRLEVGSRSGGAFPINGNIRKVVIANEVPTSGERAAIFSYHMVN